MAPTARSASASEPACETTRTHVFFDQCSLGAGSWGSTTWNPEKHGELFRELRLIVAEPFHHNRRVGKLEENRPAIDGVDRMSPEQEADDDTKISASAAQRPKQVRIVRFGRRDKAAVGEHHVRFDEIVRRQAIKAAEITVPAAQGEPRDAGRRDDPERHRLLERLRRMIDVAGGATRTHSDGPVFWIDPDALHQRQVDDQTVIDAGETGRVMPASANSDRQLVLAAEIHRRHDIGHISAFGDEKRPLVDHRVVELSRVIVVRMLAPNHRAAHDFSELGDDFGIHRTVPDHDRTGSR